MKTWDEMIKKALKMYVHKDEYAYWYGAKGEVLTEQHMNFLVRCYPNHFKQYSEKELEILKAFSLGKRGFDCSGFITEISGVVGSSAMQLGQCSNVSEDLVAGVAGSLLWKPGHVGIDIGYGFFLHMPIEGQSIVLGKISEYNWQKTGRFNEINYEGSDNR